MDKRIIEAAVDAVVKGEGSPAAKRKALLKLGVKTEYVPHQGAREIARRMRKEATKR